MTSLQWQKTVCLRRNGKPLKAKWFRLENPGVCPFGFSSKANTADRELPGPTKQKIMQVAA
jgi:hypothetical protein